MKSPPETEKEVTRYKVLKITPGAIKVQKMKGSLGNGIFVYRREFGDGGDPETFWIEESEIAATPKGAVKKLAQDVTASLKEHEKEVRRLKAMQKALTVHRDIKVM